MKKVILISVVILLSNFSFAQKTEYGELMEQDWANLKKYKTENEKIIETKNYPDVVFMGNSITEGWVNAQPQFFEKNNFAGRGISGQTTPQMLIRFIPDVVALNPKAVVILAGTNDIAGNTGFSSVEMITNNIKAMAQLAQANNIKVILASILPVYDYPWRPGLEPVQKIAEINTWLAKFAGENNHTYLDLFTPLKDKKEGLPKQYSEDGVHPNLAGYKVMAPLTKETIEKVLN
ncbi:MULTISPECIES: SGNH/GDSL hydrolase family protein [Salegentibacter]|jgi:lysophospholipase L1-like esterase|uniref:Lysophospholipase L1 n=1 Tax=Salegentibacter agarivorans TaxID=345907 RepID=A0A1I2KQZ8_9FLAO|nr:MULTISPECIES: SGNH/GDSL hydrolase family protein [Salegentibacter]APS40178.1 acylhydrolase [Salegentibacter sp. T436]SFF68943.1 Lysophospholipase L1 [Salegentibacter agarivorans]|tara:strand:- start:644 stop:1345 length:702 start_codon:yes stop_codon:yes gene_type:complete